MPIASDDPYVERVETICMNPDLTVTEKAAEIWDVLSSLLGPTCPRSPTGETCQLEAPHEGERHRREVPSPHYMAKTVYVWGPHLDRQYAPEPFISPPTDPWRSE